MKRKRVYSHEIKEGIRYYTTPVGMLHIQAIQRKARYGHKDWVIWKDRDGSYRAAPKSIESVKSALLATGTNGDWDLIGANDAWTMNCSWKMGLNMLKQMRYGF